MEFKLTIMIEEIRKKITSIDWKLYETTYGNANDDVPVFENDKDLIPKMKTQLLQLFSSNNKEALESTHNLWCSLCYQYAFVSSAALPACDFLLYGIKTLDEELKIELLDIVRGFVFIISKDQPKQTWQGKLRMKLEEEKSLFIELAKSDNEEISKFAEDILEEL